MEYTQRLEESLRRIQALVAKAEADIAEAVAILLEQNTRSSERVVVETDDCGICFEKKNKFVYLHDSDHKVCVDCRKSMISTEISKGPVGRHTLR